MSLLFPSVSDVCTVRPYLTLRHVHSRSLPTLAQSFSLTFCMLQAFSICVWLLCLRLICPTFAPVQPTLPTLCGLCPFLDWHPYLILMIYDCPSGLTPPLQFKRELRSGLWLQPVRHFSPRHSTIPICQSLIHKNAYLPNRPIDNDSWIELKRLIFFFKGSFVLLNKILFAKFQQYDVPA